MKTHFEYKYLENADLFIIEPISRYAHDILAGEDSFLLDTLCGIEGEIEIKGVVNSLNKMANKIYEKKQCQNTQSK